MYDPGFRLQGGGFHITLKGVNGFDQIEMLIHFALTGRMDCYNLDKLNDPYYMVRMRQIYGSY